MTKLWIPRNVRVALTELTKIPQCPKCGSEHVIKNGHKKGKQFYQCKVCGRDFVFPRKPKSVKPKLRTLKIKPIKEPKEPKEPIKSRMRTPFKCKGCGKPFLRKKWGQQFCYNPCQSECRIRKTKTKCEICGRKIRTQISINSSEEVICSFCIQRRQEEKNALREQRKACLTPRKCKVCGNYAFLVRNSGLCRTCYYKKIHPSILSVQEVSEP